MLTQEDFIEEEEQYGRIKEIRDISYRLEMEINDIRNW